MQIAENDINWFLEFLAIDSTTGKEKDAALWLAGHLATGRNKIELLEVGDGTVNVSCSWGTPRVWLCSHCDTVPPYIAPRLYADRVTGRGTCDAKGQIFSMFLACKELEEKGVDDFGLLVLAGEETGSFGAKAYDRDCPGAEAVIVGEPTDNMMVKASKGTRSFAIKIKGVPCHSGYPALGESAVMKFVDFVERLRSYNFPVDGILGETTWNIGELSSPSPQNILSPAVSFRLYFRTTFATENVIPEVVEQLLPPDTEIEDRGGDRAMSYFTFPGFAVTTVAFGSDAPRLSKFDKRILCGPGSIEVAHTAREFIKLDDIETAKRQYVEFVELLLDRK